MSWSNCSYQGPDGQLVLRATTVTRRWVDSAVSSEVVPVFFMSVAVDGRSFVDVIEIFGTPKLSFCKEA